MVCVWLLICGSNSLLVPNLQLHGEEREGGGVTPKVTCKSHCPSSQEEPLPANLL